MFAYYNTTNMQYDHSIGPEIVHDRYFLEMDEL
jgi:hypothetical protein